MRKLNMEMSAHYLTLPGSIATATATASISNRFRMHPKIAD